MTLGIFDVAKSAEKGAPVYHYIQTDKADGEFLTNVTFSPLGIANISRLQEKPVLATILRAGLPLHLHKIGT